MKFSIVRTDKHGIVRLSLRTAATFFERITADTKSETVGRYRRQVAAFGEASAEAAAPLPEVCPMVEMAKDANGALRVVGYNRLVALHVGGLLRAEDLSAVKAAARMLPMTLAAFIGADGRSVEILVAVAPADGRMLTDEAEIDAFCQDAYDMALTIYTGVLPRPVVRQACTARSSFRMTLDGEPYYRPDATPLQMDPRVSGNGQRRVVSGAHPVPDSQQSPDLTLYADYERLYERAAEEAREATGHAPEHPHTDAYLTALSQQLCQAGMPAEEAVLHIRHHHVRQGGLTEDTVRAIVSAAYAELRPEQRLETEPIGKETRQLIHFLTTRYVFRQNTVMGYTEYRPNNTWTTSWQACDENAVNSLTIEARLAGIKARDKDVRRYVRSNFIRRYNPIEEYLWRIRDKWDGQTDHIGLLARCVPCDVPQWDRWFRKWFLYMVAQWMGKTRRYGNALVPLLISKQGDNKSTFCRSLLPDELQWGYSDNLIVSEKRQTLQAMHSFLLINLYEFNQIPASLQEVFLKNVIQLPSVKIKRPYGRHVEDFPRLASFIATTNEAAVLSDPTGNRRFIGIRLTGPIDVGYRPNYEGLYAQAVALIERGEPYWLDEQDIQELMDHNRQFEIVPSAIQYFNEYYAAAEDETDGEWLSPTAIYLHLRKKVGAGLKASGSSRFGRYLVHMPGLKQRRVGNSRQYLVREKNRIAEKE